MRSRFHPDARVEYVDALVYVEERRTGYGEKFEAEVFAALERALLFPGSGGLVQGYPENLNLRAFPLRVFHQVLLCGHRPGRDRGRSHRLLHPRRGVVMSWTALACLIDTRV